MATTYERASENITAIVRQQCEANHTHLVEYGVTIDVLMASAELDEKGIPKGSPVKWAGYPALAVVRINPLKRRALGNGDAEITIDARAWEDMSDAKRQSLIDHELTHLEMRTDKDGVVMIDDLGRPRLSMRQHDWQLGGFAECVQRNGNAAVDYLAFREVIGKWGQLLMPWAEEAKDENLEEIRRLKGDLRITA
jgi:hypothetical protein